MAGLTIQSLHPFLKENDTKVSSGGTVKSYTHDHGSGFVFVMVHGWPQSSYMWRHTVAELKDKISLMVVDLPGYGFSSLPPKNDKRTVGGLIMEAVQGIFGKERPVMWCGHDRGGRVGHRLIVDNNPAHNIKSAILLDIVPTTEQWAAFANARAGVAYYHWPFLAIPAAPHLISSMGGGNYCKVNLERAKGGNEAGMAKFRENDAIAHYCHQFNNEECIAGSCGDYAAGAFEDVEEQEKDRKAGRKVTIPLMVIYSASNLGRMHDVEAVWKKWIDGESEFESIEGGYGHYLPEECPDKCLKLFDSWIAKHGK